MNNTADILAEASVDPKGRLRWNGSLLTSEILRSEIELFLKKNACTASRTITACGKPAAEPHNVGSGVVMAGETIIVDIFPRSDSNGYWGDMTRTFVKGKAPAKVKRAFDAVFEAKEKARKAAKAGVSASFLHEMAFKVLEKRNFPTGFKGGRHFGFIHGLGHGVGLDIHEAPRVSPLNKEPLVAGNVVTIEPGLYYSEWGGVRIEDLIVITEDGSDTLNDPSAVLEIP
jgi:Xaa-Pro aminopeptidase